MSIPYYQRHQQLQKKTYQTTQNFAARLAYKKSRRENVYICLQEIHWLPIKYKTIFKLLAIVYNELQEALQYLQEKLKHKQFPRTMRQSTSSSITLDIPFNKKNHLLKGALYTLLQNIGMTYQNTSKRPRTSSNSNLCSKHTFSH